MARPVGGFEGRGGRLPIALPVPLSASGLAFAFVDAHGVLAAVNAAFSELLAGEVHTFTGRPLGELVAGVPVDPRKLAEVVAGQRRRYTLETRVRRDDGEVVWGSVSLTPAGEVDGEAVALLLLDDTSDRRRLDEEQQTLRDLLATAASEWRATFDAIDMPIFILGAGGRAERLNRAARDLAAQDFAALLGRRLADMGEGTLWPEAEQLVERVATHHEAADHEVFDEASGRTWFLAASPALPDLSAARPIILTVREMTGLVHLQESLRRSRTMAAMGTLVAGVAHEVRNPLFGISAVVDALERRVAERAELAGHLAFLRHDLGRLEKLMADLLDYGRPVVPEPEPVTLDPVVDEALLACGGRFGEASIAVERHREEAPREVFIDRRRVVQALVNLIENAIHHAPPGSALEVGVEDLELRGQRWAQVSVRDHGPGFRDEDLPRLFEPFFSRREGGTGLGLPIVVRIVEGHGGEVEAGNADTGGALVRLRFPLSEDVEVPGAGGAEPR